MIKQLFQLFNKYIEKECEQIQKLQQINTGTANSYSATAALQTATPKIDGIFGRERRIKRHFGDFTATSPKIMVLFWTHEGRTRGGWTREG